MNDIFSIVLFLVSPEFIILFLVLGIYFGERRVVLNTLIIALFGMVFNAYLKSVFQVPLNPEIGKIGWAYPSGHAMFDVVFWGALFIQTRKPWVLVLGLAISISGFFGMVYKRYHNWPEILGGVCSGGLVLTAFYCWIRYNSSKIIVFALATLAIELALYIIFLQHAVLDYKWMRITIGIKMGLCLALPYLERLMPQHLYARAVTFILSVASVYLLQTFLHMNDFVVGATISLFVLMLIPGTVRFIERVRFRSV